MWDGEPERRFDKHGDRKNDLDALTSKRPSASSVYEYIDT